jgi:hypothetical protein
MPPPDGLFNEEGLYEVKPALDIREVALQKILKLVRKI